MFRQGGKAGPARREEATERKAARAPARAPGAAAGGGEPCHLVVLGFPRGGTSLLMNALGEHSQIAMLDEDLVGGIRRLTGSKIRGVKLCVPNQVQLDRAWNAGIHLHPVYRLLRLTGRLPTSAWRNTRPRSKWSIRDYAALPNATFVCLLRDPARSLDAIRRRQGISHEVGARMWDLFIETLTELHSMPDARTVMVSFERLLGDPENQLRALCRQVGIPFETAMLLGPRYNRRYPGQGFDPEKASTGGLPRADELGLPRRTVEGYARLLEAAI
ncbi:MAG: sulfotransferase family protein [Alphaproteobacteria bacterium]